MARLFAQGLQGKLKPLGISPAQFMALLVLWEGDGVTQQALVEELDVEQATMANTLSRMQRDDLIIRKPHPTDRRARLVFLTQKAKNIEEEAIQAAQAQNKQALSGLSANEQKEFMKLMTKTISAMKP